MTAQTPLQMVADALAQTAQTAQEMAHAAIAQIEADILAQVAHTAAQMAQDAPLVRGRALRGQVVR